MLQLIPHMTQPQKRNLCATLANHRERHIFFVLVFYSVFRLFQFFQLSGNGIYVGSPH